MDELQSRQRQLLALVVREYIDTVQPVGSTVICEKYPEIECSSATIRNELAELEAKGFLTHPYTSAGRIPTDKGYRFYVDQLMDAYRLTSREKTLVDQLQHSLNRDMNALMQETLRTLQNISENYASIVKTNDGLLAELTGQVRAQTERSRQESLYISGLSQMFYEPEFENVQNIRKVMGVLDEKEKFLQILDHCTDPQKASIHIGSELSEEDLNGYSLITREFHYKGEQLGSIGVFGPARMKYSKITTAINSIAELLDEYLETL